MKQGESVAVPAPGAERRSFLVRFAAVVCGGIVALFPFAAGWGVVTDPWRRNQRRPAGDDPAAADSSDTAKFERICSLAELAADGLPRAFPVVADIVDGWTHATNQKIGMIFLERTDIGGKPQVVAFNAECPHLGCFVDFNPSDQH